jgi:predicted transcriptional regulator
MNEFQLTLTNIIARRGTSISELAKRVGYEPFLFEKIVAGKTRQVPVDFFVRIADVLDLRTVEKDELVRAWAFGIERWTWSPNIESSLRGPTQRRAG